VITANERLKAARKAAGFRRAAEFSAAIGVAQQTYSAHERGPENGGRGLKRKVAESYSEKLSPYLKGVTAEWLLFGRGRPPEGFETPTGFAEDAVPFDHQGAEEGEKSAIIEALYPGHPNADLWTVGTIAMNLAGILPGDQIVTDLGLVACSGDVVLAQVSEGGATSTVLRRFEAPYLIANSTDASLATPVEVDEDKVTIMAVVVAKSGRL